MTREQTTEDIAVQIYADPSHENLQRCLKRIRVHQAELAAAQDQMDQSLYDLMRAREMAEAVQETNRQLEACIFLLMGSHEG